jgi:hypothetical protein
MVGMLAKEWLGRVETRRANPFNADSGALLDEVEDADGHARTAARVGEMCRFREDIVGGYEPSAGPRQAFDHRTRT